MSVVEGEAVEGVAVPSIPDVQAHQDRLPDDETHHAAGHRQGETWTRTFRPVEEVIEPVGLETGRVHDPCRVQSQGLLQDRGLHRLTAKRLSSVAGQDLRLTQGRQRPSAKGCEAGPFRQSEAVLGMLGGGLLHAVKIVHDLSHVLRRHAHDRLEDAEGHHPTLHVVEVHHRLASVIAIGDGHIHDPCQGHH
jgi:hypothetical protein